MVNYLKTKIAESKRTKTPRWGMAANGYTIRSGAPTSIMVRLVGERRFRRLMCWQYSNVGTLFLRIRGEEFVVNEFDIPQ